MKNIRHRYTIEENRQLTSRTYMIRLKGDVSDISAPGQFVNIAIPGKYLRRPISISDYDRKKQELILLYDVAGDGTLELSRMQKGDSLDILSPLGNGFSIPEDIQKPLLLGGGIGCAPLLNLAKALINKGKTPIAVLGFNSEQLNFGMDQMLSEIGVRTYVATVDGSQGVKGFVTDVISQENLDYDYFYACGPMPMLKALSQLRESGEMSIESRMGCGFGICVCCSVETRDGVKRICKDGPVFRKEELIWK